MLLLQSCVERKEHLQISSGGSIQYRLEYASDSPDDLYQGDAVPKPAEGWLVSEEIEKHDDGNTTYHFKAESVFPPNRKLPAIFAAHTDSDADLYLQFPTSLKMEHRRDGTYYHFARTYLPRKWAQIAAMEERMVKAPLAEFQDVPFEQWSPQQRMTAVRALAGFETEKMLEFAREAFKIATPDAAQDRWLLVADHLHDCVDRYDYQALLKLLELREPGQDEKARGDAVAAELKSFSDMTSDQLKQAMYTVANFSGSQFTSFMAEFDRQKKAYEISQDLGDDKFEIEVEMPGEIVASNADSTAGNTAKWSFDGEMMRDRELELLVTSRVPR
jgi:hypothetical protein